MQVGDFLICKKDYYLEGAYSKYNIFKKPYYKKNMKYQIDLILKNNTSYYDASGTTMNNYIVPSSEIVNTYLIKNKYVTEYFISEYFGDKKYIRKKKLEKIIKI
jgi:vacuolar-type H+-ATPase catalytic subunit A/Vma1